jgi:hypothetical protein
MSSTAECAICGKTVSIGVLTKVRRAGQLRHVCKWCLATEFTHAVDLVARLSGGASGHDISDVNDFLARNG